MELCKGATGAGLRRVRRRPPARAQARLTVGAHAGARLHFQALVAAEAHAVQPVQLAADGGKVLQHGAPQRLRGVRREHQVHRLLAQALEDGVRRDARVQQRLQRAVGRFHGPARNLAEALQALALAVGHLLRQVVQVEHVGEGAGRQQRLVNLAACERARACVRAAGASACCPVLWNTLRGGARARTSSPSSSFCSVLNVSSLPEKVNSSASL
jgi:hypothetical protein